MRTPGRGRKVPVGWFQVPEKPALVGLAWDCYGVSRLGGMPATAKESCRCETREDDASPPKDSRPEKTATEHQRRAVERAREQRG